jgi:DNA-binding NarL/FixJ family response regulator
MGKALERLFQREKGAKTASEALTSREIEVVRLIAAGLRNKEVSDRLNLSEGTVKVHLHNIYEKLGISGRMSLLLWARDHSLE